MSSADHISEEVVLAEESSYESNAPARQATSSRDGAPSRPRIFDRLNFIADILPKLKEGTYPEPLARDLLKELGLEWFSGRPLALALPFRFLSHIPFVCVFNCDLREVTLEIRRYLVF